MVGGGRAPAPARGRDGGGGGGGGALRTRRRRTAMATPAPAGSRRRTPGIGRGSYLTFWGKWVCWCKYGGVKAEILGGIVGPTGEVLLG